MSLTVYGLFDPTTSELRYVGATKRTLEARLSSHIREARNTDHSSPRVQWLRELSGQGMAPSIHEIAGDGDEPFWIAYFRSVGCDLLNATTGGEGSVHFSRSAESRRKIGEAHSGRKRPPEVCAKIREAKRRQYQDVEFRRRHARARGARSFRDQHGNLYYTLGEAASATGCSAGNICNVLKGKARATKGYVFSYVAEVSQ